MSNSAAPRQQRDVNNSAWLLTFGNDLHAAISELEMLHLLAEPRLVEIPGSPLHCRHVCIWNDEPLPLMDIRAWLTGRIFDYEQPLVGVVGYERWPAVDDDPFQLGGLLLPSLPKRVLVSDDQACGLPQNALNWREISISCFADESDDAIPILDLPRIFSDALVGLDESPRPARLAVNLASSLKR